MRMGRYAVMTVLAAACGGVPDPEPAAIGSGDWTLEPISTFTAAMDDTVLVNSITGLQPGHDGFLYVTMRGDRRISLLTTDGQQVRRIGGEGEGPGEFTGINGLGWRSESLWVMDTQLGRLSWFDSAGLFLGSERQPEPHLRPTSSGGLLGMKQLWVEATSTRVEFQAPGQPGLTTVKQISWIRGGFRLPQGGGTFRVGAHPLSDSPLATHHPRGQGMVVAERSAADGPVVLTWISANGAIIREERVQLEAPALTGPAWRTFLDAFFNPSLGPGISESQLDAVLVRPDRWPPVSQLQLSTDGKVWLKGPTMPGADVTWTVLDSMATRLGSITLPADLRLMHLSGDTVWTMRPNADDLDVVTRYLLRR